MVWVSSILGRELRFPDGCESLFGAAEVAEGCCLAVNRGRECNNYRIAFAWPATGDRFGLSRSLEGYFNLSLHPSAETVG